MQAANRAGSARTTEPKRTQVDRVVIRFAGDSGDGMQLTGTQFTNASALAGNDLATFPDYPAEIRAPAGSLVGVSAFQVAFSSLEVLTPGDAPDVLVAMNPAALKTNIEQVRANGIVICDTAAFTKANLKKAGYATNPLESGSLDKYQLFRVDITGLNEAAVRDIESLTPKQRSRSRNFFTLGLMYWLYDRPIDPTLEWLTKKFANLPHYLEANSRALKTGYHYGETAELFTSAYQVPAAKLKPGTYRSISGNVASALACVAAARLAGKELFLGAYPITPASDMLHELALHKDHGVVTYQAEDEIAAICATIGAAFGGALAVTTTSGPGIALKSEGMGLAVILELPLLIIDVQRGGPSTGLPTKTEQADLFQNVFGRHGESPIPVIAAASPADCFDMCIEGFRIAVKYMTPVVLLTDGYLGNGSEPWRIPNVDELPRIEVHHPDDITEYPDGFQPYARDPKTLARPWALPGTPDFMHRIGGLEKQDVTGDVSYTAENHGVMCRLRKKKIDQIAYDCPASEISGDESADTVVVGWGSTYGAIHSATRTLQQRGWSVSHLHIRHMFPFPADLGEQLSRFKRVIVAELNLGQLRQMLRAEYLIDAEGLNKVQGQPFYEEELLGRLEAMLKERSS